MDDWAEILRREAGSYARVALANIKREFPSGIYHTMKAPGDFPYRPRARTPAFYGSFDWHSCVHSYWMLARLVRRFPAMAPASAIRADRDVLRQALQRTAILSNEKYRGIRVTVKKNVVTVQAHNPEQEEAEEEIEVGYDGSDLEVGFNVNYLLDALAAIDGQEVELGLTDSNSSCLIRSPGTATARYVVMPMRL